MSTARAPMSWGDKFKIGATAGGLGAGALFNLGGGFKNPYDESGNLLNQIPGTITPFYKPSIDAGNRQIPGLEELFGKMTSNPDEFLSMLGKGYKKSPGYDWKLGQGESAINNAEAAGGMLGTPEHQQEAGQLAENMSSDDYESYLNHVLGLLSGGISGKQGLMTNGQQSSNDLATNLAQVLMSRASNSTEKVNADNQSKGGGMGDLFGGIASLASLFL